MRLRIAVGLGLAVLILVTAAVAFFLGDKHAMDGLSIKRVTATEIANAMKDDRFYADYGQSTLLLGGTISSLNVRGGAVIAEFKSDSSFQVLCDLGAHATNPRTGSRITIITEGSGAERQPSAVFLHDCVIPPQP